LVIDAAHAYGAKKSKQDPVGLTACSSEKLDEMLASHAEWASPGVCVEWMRPIEGAIVLGGTVTGEAHSILQYHFQGWLAFI
jgi:hypothetical protein